MNTRNRMTDKSLKQIEKIVGEKLTLGKLMWAIRMSAEATQVDFAKKLGVSRQHLCDIEHNRKTIGPALAKKYAETLEYPTEQFIRLSLQDLVDREGLNVIINVKLNKSRKGGQAGDLVYA